MKRYLSLLVASAFTVGCEAFTGPPDPTPNGGESSGSFALLAADANGGLVSWWRGEGDADDEVGSNHGVIVGAVEFGEGVSGQGFRFAHDGLISIPDDPSLDLDQEVTLAFWFSYPVVPAGYSSGLVAKRWGNWGVRTNYGVNIRDIQTTGLAQYYNQGSGFQFTATYPVPTADEFHHFVGTYRQVDETTVELRTYLDGNLVRDGLFGGSLRDATNDMPMTIGASWAVSSPSADRPWEGELFEGTIDEIMLFNCAFDEQQVADLAAGEMSTTCGNVATPMAQEILTELRAEIVALRESGVLNRGQANALLTKVDHTIALISEDGIMTEEALETLNALTNQIHAFINGNILTLVQGQGLLELATQAAALTN